MGGGKLEAASTSAPDEPCAALMRTAEERRQRQEAVRFANASVELAGFRVSEEAHVRADRFIAGEIDLAEFLRQGT